MDRILKIGVLISGSGTNLQAILDSIEVGFPLEVVLVVSSRPDAYGISRAQEAKIPVLVLDRCAYEDPEHADGRIVEALLKHGAEYVVMAGYMRKVTPVLLNAFPQRVINIHPALLPAFPGAHAIKDARSAGVKITGVTVHFANEEYDQGPIIAQRPVVVLDDDTEESLAERIHEVEHVLYPEVLKHFANGEVQIDEKGIVCVNG